MRQLYLGVPAPYRRSKRERRAAQSLGNSCGGARSVFPDLTAHSRKKREWKNALAPPREA
jgi:hypothetical protein